MSDFKMVRLSCTLTDELVLLFSEIKKSGDDKFFNPHGYEYEDALKIANYKGKDIYCVSVLDGIIISYGMLRGWDEGYDIPSLGIYLHKIARGTGLSKLFMQFLHFSAKTNGASKIRLTVYKDNEKAIKLYKKLGYVIQDYNDESFLGILNL